MSAARVVFPFACLVAGKYSTAAMVVCAIAAVEWPVYGYIVGRSARKLMILALLLTIHITLTLLLFLGPWERWQFQ
jgi:hypothetical protein